MVNTGYPECRGSTILDSSVGAVIYMWVARALMVPRRVFLSLYVKPTMNRNLAISNMLY